MPLRIANAAGFWGDDIAAARRLVESAAVDYLTLEYLAELTMSILAAQREKDPAAGFAGDFLLVLNDLLPALKSQPQLRIVTNAGGMNPAACATVVGKLLSEAGLGEVRVACVSGDDLLPRLAELQAAGCPFLNFDSGRPLSELAAPIVSANAYLGAAGILEALQGGARIVITGRVADASLTLGPAVHEFGWDWQDYDLLAASSVAGHLIECGAQATGGFFTHWQEIEHFGIGYPIVELEADGMCVITKPPGSGGAVTVETVSEQLVYEIGDPAAYLTPDVTVDFRGVTLEEIGRDRVRVRGARGTPPPETLKVSLAYRDGFTASGQLLVYGRDCIAKAKRCAEIVLDQVRRAGFDLEASHVELLGTGEGVPGLSSSISSGGQSTDPPEVMLRLTVRDARREAVECFSRQFAPLITAGPAGLAGYASGRPAVRPVFAYWPTLVPRTEVVPRVDVRCARDL